MPPKRETTKWDGEVHRDIVIGILSHVTLSTQDWTNLMESLQSMGHTFTESALRYELCGFCACIQFLICVDSPA